MIVMSSCPDSLTSARRRFTLEQKKLLLRVASISLAARKHHISPSQLYSWKKLMEHGSNTAIAAEDEVIPLTEHRKLLARVRELERQLGKKTMESEILREAVQLARKKKLISDTPLQLPDDIL